MEQYMWIIWLSIFIITIIIEAAGPELVSVWFVAGSFVSLILSFFNGIPWWVEMIAFIAVSTLTILFIRPYLVKFTKTNKVDSNIDEIIGKKAQMTKACDELNYGELKLNGVIWTAMSSESSQPIEKDAIVEVVAVSGNKLIVKEIKKEEE